jgi:DNA-binding GntR family transcriptional regulator
MAYRQPLLAGSLAIRKAFQRRTRKSVEAHGQLVDLIEARKPAQAEKFWRNYMVDTAEFISSKGFAALPIRASSYS